MRFKFLKTLSILALMIFFSCSKEDFVDDSNLMKNNSTVEQTKYKPVSIEEAKSYFSTNFSKSKNLLSKGDQNLEMIPLWEHSETTEIANYKGTATQVPVKTNFNGSYAAYLVFIKDENEKISGILTTFYPLKYNDVKHYNGDILNFDLDGNYLSGYQYKNGYITEELMLDKTKRIKKRSASPCSNASTQYWNENNPMAQIPCPISLPPVTVSAPMGGGPPSQGVIPFPTAGVSNTPPPHVGIPNHANTMVVDSPENPIDNLKEYLKCFDTSKGATLSIYIDQPIANENDSWTSGSGKAGHAFIGLKQGRINRVWGLYPKGNASPLNRNEPYAFGNNQQNNYDVKISVPISNWALKNIINDAINYSTNYDLNSNNCTDYVIQAALLAGIKLPDPQSTWPRGKGSNPGAFGQAVRKMKLPKGATRDNSGGISETNSGCH